MHFNDNARTLPTWELNLTISATACFPKVKARASWCLENLGTKLWRLDRLRFFREPCKRDISMNLGFLHKSVPLRYL
jgi:hypothetical protein